eukprot:SAG22_NODE_366_length_11615_cov_13.379125_9_plen_217_part_00
MTAMLGQLVEDDVMGADLADVLLFVVTIATLVFFIVSLGPARIWRSITEGASAAADTHRWNSKTEEDIRNLTIEELKAIDEVELLSIGQDKRDLIVLTHLKQLHALPNFPNVWPWKVEWAMKFKHGASTVDRLINLEALTIHINATAVENDSWDVFVSSLEDDARELKSMNTLKCNLEKAYKAKMRLGIFVIDREDVRVKHNIGPQGDNLRSLTWS